MGREADSGGRHGGRNGRLLVRRGRADVGAHDEHNHHHHLGLGHQPDVADDQLDGWYERTVRHDGSHERVGGVGAGHDRAAGAGIATAGIDHDAARTGHHVLRQAL